jgi:hypothetical protein
MIPRDTLRLFDGHDPADLEDEQYRSFVVGRLLEDGDSQDLRWLFESFGAEELRAWLPDHAPQRLSERSRGFWTWISGFSDEAREAMESKAPALAGSARAESVWPF